MQLITIQSSSATTTFNAEFFVSVTTRNNLVAVRLSEGTEEIVHKFASSVDADAACSQLTSDLQCAMTHST